MLNELDQKKLFHPTNSENQRQLYPFLENLPGGGLIWIVFWLEILTFALFFLVFAWIGRTDRTVFIEGQKLLHPLLATLNTVVLLTGSWWVARAVFLARSPEKISAWLYATGLSGFLFILIKSWEYTQIFKQGISLSSSIFWFFYLFLTLLHLAHVALGGVIFIWLGWKSSSERLQTETLEAAAIYWHMVDIIWLILFPLIYFTR